MVDFFFKKVGSGGHNLVFFHGFGEDHTVFMELVDRIQSRNKETTCYLIDIYFHGKSLREAAPLRKSDWKNAFQKFIDQENITSFHLFGFSLGARFAISLAMQFPQITKSIWLMAPDGIFQSNWYRFANSYLGNALFKYLARRPDYFDRVIAFFGRSKIVSSSMIKFVEKTLSNDHSRILVYQTWTFFHPLQYPVSQITSTFNKHDFKKILILGVQDRVIESKKILPLLRHVNDIDQQLVPAKHHQVINTSIPSIISTLKPILL